MKDNEKPCLVCTVFTASILSPVLLILGIPHIMTFFIFAVCAGVFLYAFGVYSIIPVAILYWLANRK
jgi:hypothetical protein